MEKNKKTIIVLLAITVVAVVVVVVLRRDSPQSVQPLSDAQIYNPDAVIDIHVDDETIVDGPTTITAPANKVTKLQFHVKGEEQIIHVTGNGINLSTEADGTSALPSGIFIGGLAPGTYELLTVPDGPDGIAEKASARHQLGKVVVTQ